MLFNSIEFLVFLPLFFISYWFFFNRNLKAQNFLILFGSYLFYGWWDYRFLALIFLSTLVDYYVGLALHSSKRKAQRQSLLTLSVLFNLGILGFFKYFNFFTQSFIDFLDILGFQVNNVWALEILLPVGISFYTFQTMSYTLDIYKGKLEPTADFISFASFVSFFPQLVAGPIERASNLLPQMLEKRKFDYQQSANGLFLIVNGFFRKVVLADNFAVYVDSTWNNIESASVITLCLGAFLFGLQIYFDFSGYSNIARGIAKLLGFELMVNFDRPYVARRITEFWGRWHISLSTWFRDYVYIPLGGNRMSLERWTMNIAIVFLLSGLWHGANWTFIVWALIHVSLYFIEKISPRLAIRATTQLGVFFAWIFFRSSTVDQATEFVVGIFTNDFYISLSNILQGIGPLETGFMMLNVLLIPILYKVEDIYHQVSYKAQIGLLSLMLVYTCLFFEKSGGQFIYFQF